MRLLRFLIPVAFLISVVVGHSGCRQKSKNAEAIPVYDPMDDFREKALKVFPDYSSIPDIARLLQETEVEFLPGLVNEIGNVELYVDNELLMAANIGTYMADISYLYSYGRQTEAFDSHIAALALADNLHIAMFFLETYFQRYEGDEADLDTMLLKLDQQLLESGKRLSEDERFQLHAALLTGNLIEKIYLVFSMIHHFPAASISGEQELQRLQKLLWIACGQKASFVELNKLINRYAIREGYRKFFQETVRLEEMMGKEILLNEKTKIQTVDQVKSESFSNLYREIVRIRDMITEPSIVK